MGPAWPGSHPAVGLRRGHVADRSGQVARGTGRRGHHRQGAGTHQPALRREGSGCGRRDHARAGEARDADRARPELEGAPGAHGLPAPGHLPARLCAEAAEAGIQEGSLRAVLGHAGERQARSGDPAGSCAHPQRRGSAGTGSGRAPAGGSPPEAVAVPAPGRRRLQCR
ncbi:hypothetical protein D3C72_1777160 [compost metagenome]